MNITRCTLLATLLLSTATHGETNAQLLISGCQELVEIYKTRGEKNLFASFTTSEAEAFRAGYCRGILEQYQRENSCWKGWHQQASYIALQTDEVSVSRLLRDSCQ